MNGIVVDTTCLIGLERIGRLDILSRIFPGALIPRAVLREWNGDPHDLRIVDATNIDLVRSLTLHVDPGEAEVIALALELELPALLDDRKARELAARLNIRVVGTIGLILRAKRNGVIPTIAPLLNGLRDVGFHMSDALYDEALRLSDERRG